MHGPIDYIIVGFEGNNFTGEILQELQKAVESGVIDVLALTVVAKDQQGMVTTVELTGDALAIATSLKTNNSLVSEDDIEEVGDLLENNTAAGLLIVEQLWAKGLKQAIMNAGGFLIADGRIHPDASEELDKEDK